MKFKIISEDEKAHEQLLEAIKRRHHHDDGSKAEIGLLNDAESIERKVIEEENLWQLQTQQNAEKEMRSSNNADVQPREPQRNSDQPMPIKKQQNTVMAGCNCGKSFSAQKEDSTTIRITAFDNAGKVSGSYTVAGDSSASYGVSGQQSESYAASGSAKENYS